MPNQAKATGQLQSVHAHHRPDRHVPRRGEGQAAHPGGPAEHQRDHLGVDLDQGQGDLRQPLRLPGHGFVAAAGLLLGNSTASVRKAPFADESYGRALRPGEHGGKWKALWTEPPHGPADGHWQRVRPDEGPGREQRPLRHELRRDQGPGHRLEDVMTSVGGVEPAASGRLLRRERQRDLLQRWRRGPVAVGARGAHRQRLRAVFTAAPHAASRGLGTEAQCTAYGGLPAGWGADTRTRHGAGARRRLHLRQHEGLPRRTPPASSAWVPSFWIDQTEVTVAQFAAFVKATAYVTEAERQGGAVVFHKPTDAEMNARPMRGGPSSRAPTGNTPAAPPATSTAWTTCPSPS